jgi:hypothetical protein
VYPDGTAAGRIKRYSEEKKYVEMIYGYIKHGGAEAVHLRDIIDDIISASGYYM